MSDSKNIKSVKLLPNFYQTDANKKFLHATIEQLIQPGTVKKIDGYIGRQYSKATVKDDVFISEPTNDRQQYQLEPGIVIKDDLGNTSFYKDYIDYINQLSVFGSPITNHQRLNNQELYSWDPHIDWDKFVNFQNYYWLPYGPDVITVYGQQQEITSTFEIIIESQGDSNAYIFSPKGSVGLIRNPTIKLYKGQTYKFEVNSLGNIFSIKTKRSNGIFDRFNDTSVINNSITSGTITFTVPHDCPDVLYYVSESDIDLGGVFQILSIDENTKIDVDSEIIGKKTYTLPDGTSLSNGMKIRFVGNVLPIKYESGLYYVEGVGDSINLINEKDLELISQYTTSQAVLFDNNPFDAMPFSDATSFPGLPDYVVINRNSTDRNPWSRYNRWFHKTVIEVSAKINNKSVELDQTARAVRPIIEFEGNLKLHNFGTNAIFDVDLIDDFTKDAFSIIEGQLGYNIDGINVIEGQRVLFTADTDNFVKNKIFKVQFLTFNNIRQIHLELESEPSDLDVVLIRQGKQNRGQMYWYRNETGWNLAQEKSSINQPPLFDIVDENKNSYSNKNEYDGSTFNGTKLFSYSLGVGDNDPYLGFPLSYKNINNIGDILFKFDLLSDSFQYKDGIDVKVLNIKTGFLIKTINNVPYYVNGWKKCEAYNIQAAIRIYKDSKILNNFPLDLYDDKNNLEDLKLNVYINGIRLDQVDISNNPNWSIQDGPVNKFINLTTDVSNNDVVSIKAFSKQPINNNGFYEIPVNLQNNPLNEDLKYFTLGEVIDHVGSIVENTPYFAGSLLGSNNLRDLGSITRYGTKFVQHSGPLSLSLYHITSEQNNVIRAIEQSSSDYNRFKKNFMSVAETLGVDADSIKMVDLILQKINKDKTPEFPYYFSDMVPYGSSRVTEHTVIDYRIKSYPISSIFDLETLSNKSIIIYRTTLVNDTPITEQLLHAIDYTFDPQGFVVISSELVNDDIVTIYEYDDTNGSFVPATPTKLGIWPKYEPKKYLNTALITPREVIQGHDGSQILAYGDYRDDLILELEKRIFNNIKVSYDPDIFDIFDIIPGVNRTTDYSIMEFNQTLSPYFYKWASVIDRDFTKSLSYDRNNPITYNYRNHIDPAGNEVPGYWRGIYRWILDTDRPNIAPWEMLGFFIKPTWWEEVYGPAPYTSNNLILWEDLSNGLIREPGKPLIQKEKFVRPFVVNNIPVDEFGNILSPVESGLATGSVTQATEGDFVFGDVSPVEAAWRTSSYYPFSVIAVSLLLYPAKVFGLILDRSRIVKNLANQIVYKDSMSRIAPSSIVLPSIYASETSVYTSGIINYIVDYILSENLTSYKKYKYDLLNLKSYISYRIGGFTSKEKFKFILDSKSPLSSSTVFVPQEDYEVILNKSSSIKKITYSGVIITKLDDGYELKGYSRSQPYFKYYNWRVTGPTINIGGISESYTIWTPGEYYGTGTNVKYDREYYRTTVSHTAFSDFNRSYFSKLSQLPIIGGREAAFRTEWDKSEEIILPYNTKLRTIQDVVDFLLGYGEWLTDQGFRFDNFDNNLKSVTDWKLSAKEFMFWTTQNWSTGEDKWTEWSPQDKIEFETIVRYNGEYYQAIRTIEPADLFNYNDYVRLERLSTIGSSVISLSPSAGKLTFNSVLSIPEDIRNDFNGYEIFSVDGSPIPPKFINYYREDNLITYIPSNTDSNGNTIGIYCASFYLKQIEQVIIFNNSTIFNDTIYNPASGYRQERIKVSGYKTSVWDGSFNAPGFVLDRAEIQEWIPWKDYNLGDTVKYKEFYYSAKAFLEGTETFDTNEWIKLDRRPDSKLLPNWTYKASQFEDFYSLDSDNFDADQQSMAQHLIGYQKRQYLSNIIKNDVSEYKFYQGMIAEKGTLNVFNKLFDVLSANDKESLEFYEEWAVRVGNYGASCAFENIEFVLEESKFKTNPQGFELVNTVDKTKTDFIIRQLPSDLYLKPIGYSSDLWKTLNTSTKYLRSPGYVRISDVSVVLKTLDDIINTDINFYTQGDYIWVGFENQSWNVYKISNSNLRIVSIQSQDQIAIIKVLGIINLRVGDIIGINNDRIVQSFFKVIEVNLDTLVVSIPDFVIINNNSIDYNSAFIIELVPYRFNTIDEIDVIPVKRSNDLIWVDNTSELWSTWQYNSVYVEQEFQNVSLKEVNSTIINFGKTVLVNNDGNLAVIANTLGELITYDKASPVIDWTHRDTIIPTEISNNVGITNPNDVNVYGDVLSISPNSEWLFSGAPFSNNVSTKYIGQWSNLEIYSKDDIVKYNNFYYKARSTVKLILNNLVTANEGSFVYQDETGAYGYIRSSVINSTEIILIKTSTIGFSTSDTISISNDNTPSTLNQAVIPTSILQIFEVPIGTVPSESLGYWKKVYYVPVDLDGENSIFDKQGSVAIYRKDRNNIFRTVDIIVSPNSDTNEKFGCAIASTNTSVMIGAHGYDNNRGIVYHLNYKDRVEATAYYNPIGSIGAVIKLSKTENIEEGMSVSGVGFNSGQYVARVLDQNTIVLNAAPDSLPDGNLEFTIPKWGYLSEINSPGVEGENFGQVISLSDDHSVLAISAPGTTTVGKVYIYIKDNNSNYTLSQTIIGEEVRFGESVSVSDDGSYLAISSIKYDGLLGRQGDVTVYTRVNGHYVTDILDINNSPQHLTPIDDIVPDTGQKILFGSKISFMNNYKTLIVYSRHADGYKLTKFADGTTFDNEMTGFGELTVDSGRVDVYDRYNKEWVHSETLNSFLESSNNYGNSFSAGGNHVLIGAKTALVDGVSSGRVYDYSKSANSYSWRQISVETKKVDLSKIKRAYLYNKVNNKLVTYIDVIDPSQGKIPGPSDQEIKFKTFYDPAVYSVGTNEVVVDDGMSWGSKYVGFLWWDLRTAKFIESNNDDVVYRNNTWNTLFPEASIDIYEWVESSLTPSEWDDITDTEEGLSDGISGTTLYGDSVYSLVKKYDNVSRSFKNTYYYWVKNKKTIPNKWDRKLSAQDVSDLIKNPRGEGYRFLALTGSNSFTLCNVDSLLEDNNIILSIEYWTTDKVNQNIHSQWDIINTSNSSNIPSIIEQKWFDSLCGKDEFSRLVPDMSLPIKIRYGVENRPRQGMFVNRFEALKQIFEHINRVLISRQITEQRDLSQIQLYNTEPSVITGLYDEILDTDLELRFAASKKFIKPFLTPTIKNGRITGATIVEKGKGYVNPPYIEVIGSGEGAILKTRINEAGQIIGVNVERSGIGYDSNTVFILRNYSVLVHSDTQASNGWSIYSYDTSTQVWSRIFSQSYDTRNYWHYVDWYDSGYNQFTTFKFAVDTFVELSSIFTEIGDIVKVRTNNSNRWMLLKKYSEVDSIDWTLSYKVVGLQNGTIQFDSSIYNYLGTKYGYDGTLYDTAVFDLSASTEIRYILKSLRDDILIDDLKSEYNNIFFITLRYALSEQLNIDWVFKTSFIKAKHSVGELKQKITYNNDNLSDFENYVSEVKPYRTQIREYVSSYSKLDEANSAVTDFDLPAIYQSFSKKIEPISVFVENNEIFADSSEISKYPWKFWLDSVGFSVIELKIVNGGSGYQSEPVVRFISDVGNGATARAFISNGVVNRVVLKTSGSGYLTAPTVIIDGGLSVDGVQATAVAIIGNSFIRSNLVKMKFDRITYSNFLTYLPETETFIGTGRKIQFQLTWAPNIRIGSSTVLIDGIEELRDNYKLSIKKSTTNGYTSFSGILIFDTAPAEGQTITISYLKDWSILNAADRIYHYYNSAIGELGKDLSQLMTGIDYGGVEVYGLNFEVGSGWDSLPFYNDTWDSFDNTTNDDYIVVVDEGTSSFELPYTPPLGTEINLYYSKIKTVAYQSNGSQLRYIFDTDVIYPPTITVSKTTETVGFTEKGTDVINVQSTTGINIGDIVTINPANNSVISYNTKVINIGNTFIVLDQIIFDTIIAGTELKFSRTLADPADCRINKNGTVILENPITDGNNIEISSPLRAVRIDDLNFGTVDQTNTYAVMETWIANGTETNISFNPLDFNAIFPEGVQTGDKFILRKATSDGSTLPQPSDYDTALTGGDLSYNTAIGLSPDDILVDGDGFVTPISSNAPEEIVPGQVVDSVSIKVFDRAVNGSANIKLDLYVGNGINDKFLISQQLNSRYALVVKITNGINDLLSDIPASQTIVQQLDVDYSLDYRNNEITFVNPPADGALVSISSFGFNASNILDLDHKIGDGVTKEFISTATWVEDFTFLVYVDGEEITEPDLEIFKTTSVSSSSNRIGIRFLEAPSDQAVINYVFVSGNVQTFSVIKSERFDADGSIEYNLQYISGIKLPVESNMIVRVGQRILSGPTNSYFIIDNNVRKYYLDSTKYAPFSLEVNNIVVIANQSILIQNTDYSINASEISITITKKTYDLYEGSELIISVIQDSNYVYLNSNPPKIRFSENYTDRSIEVITAYNHNILDIQRTEINVKILSSIVPGTVEHRNYLRISTGQLLLDRSVIDDQYIWVIKNGVLLTPSIDFKLNDNKRSITLSREPNIDDKFVLLTFGDNILTSDIAYMQFKDMLNRTHYKRLSQNKQTKLIEDLRYYDLVIKVEDARNFDLPNANLNKPGIIEIRGERIEYFSLTTEEYTTDDLTTVIYVLGQLRRGTLGTGTPKIHRKGSAVQEIGSSETIPYQDSTVIDQIISDGTHLVNLDFVPNKVTNTWNYETGFVSSIPTEYGQSDDIEVFVGGYDISETWKKDTPYTVDKIVIVGSYYYKCVTSHTSSSTFKEDINNWIFFAGNIRLKKSPYKLYNVNNSPDSTTGDVQFDADFSVDGISKQLRLTTPLKYGTQITIVKKFGKIWNLNEVRTSNSKVASFLKATPSVWYTGIDKYESASITASSFDNSNSTFDETSATFDQG